QEETRSDAQFEVGGDQHGWSFLGGGVADTCAAARTWPRGAGSGQPAQPNRRRAGPVKGLRPWLGPRTRWPTSAGAEPFPALSRSPASVPFRRPLGRTGLGCGRRTGSAPRGDVGLFV